MKTMIFSIAIIAVAASGCGNSNDNTAQVHTKDSTTTRVQTANTTSTASSSLDGVVAAYLQLKNDLAADNGKNAAAAGHQLHEAMQELDDASFTAEQKKVYDEVKEDINEHAEHISTNADKIAHQREHFEVLSQDIYDLIKVAKPDRRLYKDYCPMYNDRKGALWLSESKEIKNPYFGKKMLDCGEVKEEIKQ